MKRFLLIYCFLAFCLVPATLFATPLDAGFLYFKFLDMKKEKNGQVSQAIELICTDPGAGTIQVLYQENQDPVVFLAPATDGVVTLFVDKSSHIRLFAIAVNRAGLQKKTLVAHTNLVLFGKSVTPAQRIMADDVHANQITLLPSIQLMSPERYYWHQTGQPLKFYIQSPVDLFPVLPGKLQMAVLENHRITPLVLNQLLDFSYTPPHDERLKKAGALALRQDILYASMRDKTSEYALTYSLVLHRSRHGFDNSIAGVFVFGVSLLFCVGLILKKRRTPWWKT